MVCTSTRTFCVECRGKNLPTHLDTHITHTVSSRWRAPSKHNNLAWKRIANGEIWWDRRAISKKQRQARRDYNERKFQGKLAVEEAQKRLQKIRAAQWEEAKKERELGPPTCGHEYCLISYNRAISVLNLSNREDYEGCPR